MYAEVHPTPVSRAELVVFNDPLAEELGLDISLWKNPELLAGNFVPKEFTPIAQAYIGHQFGYPTMLGDGRAILLDEVLSPQGERFDIQLKGAGRTPYSRRGDGRAVIGPMLREYLVSEAMHALGIPTSRSLAVVLTGEPVYRERAFPGAILTRVASSHLRVGTLQYARSKNVIKEVSDYTIARHDPLCKEESEPYLCFFQEVLSRQAKLIALWQAFGFIHGVMNTDNMTISGETIDYGPCAFMDTYRADQVFSSIDQTGRYRYSHQPLIAKWNLARLADALIPLIDREEQTAIDKLLGVLNTFEEKYREEWRLQFGKKFGLVNPSKEDVAMMEAFLELLEKEEMDFTNSFLQLSDDPFALLFPSEKGVNWQNAWRRRVKENSTPEDAKTLMLSANPRVIPRNILLEEVLGAARSGDIAPFKEMLEIVTHPFSAKVPEKYLQSSPSDKKFVTYCGT